jgi:Asp-tRNA(Asn)/Glu-tRNA(Gln) amidotransferase A subunit family amidase
LDYTAGIIPVTKVDVTLDALPVAVQVVGRRLEEEKVLSIMSRIEGALEANGGKYSLLEIDRR